MIGGAAVNRKYLGDSYDAVKRLWQSIFESELPLYAEPRFIPKELRPDFTRLTRIPLLPTSKRPHALLNDPDTGIRLPGRPNQRESREHIAVSTIAQQLEDGAATCVVTFDQSQHRLADLSALAQRTRKLEALRELQCCGFYYVSHAPFLFAFRLRSEMQRVSRLLIEAGIPQSRLEALDDA
jgi:hypothetical protein